MKILTRYLLRAHLGPFLFAFAALTGLLLINVVAKEMSKLAGKGLPWEVIGRFFVLFLPANVALTLPMAVLVAVLYTFSQLTAENQITALKASGVNLRRLLLPLFTAAGLITLGMVWFNDQVLSESNWQLTQLMVDLGRKSPLVVLQEGVINAIPTQDGRTRYFLRAGSIDVGSSRLRDVTIYDVSNPQVNRTIYADSGAMRFSPDRTDLFLRLYSGEVREVDFDRPESFQRLRFQQQFLRMEGVGNTLDLQEGGTYRDDRAMSIAMLNARTDTLRRQLAEVRQEGTTAASRDLANALGKVPESASPYAPAITSAADRAARTASELRSAGTRVSGLERQIRSYQVEVQKKFSIAVATLVFVLIGAPLAIRFPRGGIGMVISASLLIFSLYYIGLIGGESLANEGYVSPVVAMWGMNIVMTLAGLVGFARLGRETGTSRGGGWSDWRAVLRERLRLRRFPLRGEAA